MTNAPVASEVHQSLDVHRRLAAQVALYDELCYRVTDTRDFGFRQVLNLGLRRNARRFADLPGTRVADAIDRRQRDDDVLVYRNIYACYSSHFNYL